MKREPKLSGLSSGGCPRSNISIRPGSVFVGQMGVRVWPDCWKLPCFIAQCLDWNKHSQHAARTVCVHTCVCVISQKQKTYCLFKLPQRSQATQQACCCFHFNFWPFSHICNTYSILMHFTSPIQSKVSICRVNLTLADGDDVVPVSDCVYPIMTLIRWHISHLQGVQ